MAEGKLSKPVTNTSGYAVSKPESAMGKVIRRKKLAKAGKMRPGTIKEPDMMGSPPMKESHKLEGGY
jgi:hypothetical protein